MTFVTQKIIQIVSMLAVGFVMVLAFTATTQAAVPRNFAAASCPGGQTNADFNDEVCCPDKNNSKANGTNCFIAKYINPVIALSAVVIGVIVVISLIVAGIQYSSAAGDPSKIQLAKKRIINAIGALLAYLFLFGILQWLIPGGFV